MAIGSLYFDFIVRPDLLQHTHQIQDYFRRHLDKMDPWKGGDNIRNGWLRLFDVEDTPSQMPGYVQSKTQAIPDLNTFTVRAEQKDDYFATSYCYSGNAQICYHPFHFLDQYGNPWILQSSPAPVKPLIVLTYETIVFPITTP